MKTCRCCIKKQPLENYTKNQKTKDGLNTQCKSCVGSKRLDRIMRKNHGVDRYGLTPYQINTLSAKNQATLRAIKDGVYSKYHLGKDDFCKKHGEQTRVAYDNLMDAIYLMRKRRRGGVK